MQPSGSLKGDSFLSLIFEIIGTHIQTKKKKAMSYGKKSRRIGKKKTKRGNLGDGGGDGAMAREGRNGSS